MARLKVFETRIGFFETVVAAPSRKTALAAWGVTQNLFAEGTAKIAEDAAAVSAALAHPGVVLRRATGSKDAFAVDAAPPEAPAGKGRKSKPAADRAPLDKAQDAARAEEADYAERREALERKRAAIDDNLDALAEKHESARKVLARDVTRARAAYRAAGGRDSGPAGTG